ncbi:MAG: carbon storage regulator [Planctomycetia bacterium]|nr:carbon storage regulator [Planctomycetia bacterium]
MLVLGRKIGEFVILKMEMPHGTEYVRITLTQTKSDRGRIGVQAGRNVIVSRDETLTSEEQNAVLEFFEGRDYSDNSAEVSKQELAAELYAIRHECDAADFRDLPTGAEEMYLQTAKMLMEKFHITTKEEI